MSKNLLRDLADKRKKQAKRDIFIRIGLMLVIFGSLVAIQCGLGTPEESKTALIITAIFVPVYSIGIVAIHILEKRNIKSMYELADEIDKYTDNGK